VANIFLPTAVSNALSVNAGVHVPTFFLGMSFLRLLVIGRIRCTSPFGFSSWRTWSLRDERDPACLIDTVSACP